MEKLKSDRMLAGIIDFIIFMFIATIITLVVLIVAIGLEAITELEVDEEIELSMTYGYLVILSQIGFYILYYALIPLMSGGKTIGKMFTQIRLVDTRTERTPNLLKLIFRTPLTYLLLITFFIGYGSTFIVVVAMLVIVGVSENGQTFTDKKFGVAVVSDREHSAIQSDNYGISR